MFSTSPRSRHATGKAGETLTVIRLGIQSAATVPALTGMILIGCDAFWAGRQRTTGFRVRWSGPREGVTLQPWSRPRFGTSSVAGGILRLIERLHRGRGDAENLIRGAKQTGLENLPFREFALNAVWLEPSMIAQD